jgi:hypothetical protein
MRPTPTVAAFGLLLAACACPPPTPVIGPPTSPAPTQPPAGPPMRAAAVEASHAHYARLEGASLPNSCSADSDCFAAGCANEVCSAIEDPQFALSTNAQEHYTCDDKSISAPVGGSCGCISGTCTWYQLKAAPVDAPVSKRGESCLEHGRCTDGLACVSYYGIAGAKGPTFASCETPCKDDTSCDKGTTCTTVADGPGRVCR